MKKITLGTVSLVLLSLFCLVTSNAAEFITVYPGTYIKGSPISEKGRYGEDQFQVTLTSSFQLQKTEVTQLEWYRIMGDNPSKFSKVEYCQEDYKEIGEIGVCPNLPVDSVSFFDVLKFIEKLNEMDTQFIYRLPTEAEWEYAARAGSTTAFYFGDDVTQLKHFSWYTENSTDRTHKVGTKEPNDWGFFDMAGNAYEWVSDWYSFSSPNSSQVNPQGPLSGANKVLKGGSWFSYPLLGRSASRNYSDPRAKASYIGFRLLRIEK